MNTDLAVERSGGEDVWVSRTPGGLEGPIGARWQLKRKNKSATLPSAAVHPSVHEAGRRDQQETHLSNNLACLRIPHNRPIILSTTQQHVWILLAPRNGENSLVVSGQDLFGLCESARRNHNERRPQVPREKQSGRSRGLRSTTFSSHASLLTFSGALEFLRSQTMMIGEVSSSEEVMSLVDYTTTRFH